MFGFTNHECWFTTKLFYIDEVGSDIKNYFQNWFSSINSISVGWTFLFRLEVWLGKKFISIFIFRNEHRHVLGRQWLRPTIDRKYIEQPLRASPITVTTRTPIITNAYSSSSSNLRDESSLSSKTIDHHKTSDATKYSSSSTTRRSSEQQVL